MAKVQAVDWLRVLGVTERKSTRAGAVFSANSAEILIPCKDVTGPKRRGGPGSDVLSCFGGLDYRSYGGGFFRSTFLEVRSHAFPSNWRLWLSECRYRGLQKKYWNPWFLSLWVVPGCGDKLTGALAIAEIKCRCTVLEWCAGRRPVDQSASLLSVLL